MTERRCPQCWKPGTGFLSDRPGAMCAKCRALYGSGGRRSPEERRARLGRAPGAARVLVIKDSKNRKLGGIPSTLTSAETCPDACSLKGDGCYAEFHVLGHHWSRAASEGLAWGDFLSWVWTLPVGQLWRHNVAGDLPGDGDTLDVVALRELVSYRRRGRGFTFTHKPLRTPFEQRAVREANRAGFTVNLSADSIARADELAALEVGPVAALVPPGTRTGEHTPAGHRIVVCPAQTSAELTCAQCRLCSRADRAGVVGFYPHGQMGSAIARRLPVLQPAAERAA